MTAIFCLTIAINDGICGHTYKDCIQEIIPKPMSRTHGKATAMSLSKLTLFLLVPCLVTLNGLAAQHVFSAPPSHQALLGTETYITMPMHRLAQPRLIYADQEALKKRGISIDQVLEKFAFASPVDGESAHLYTNEIKTAYVDGNGGIGLNENFGSGRAAIIEQDWQIKGSGRTPMVNPNADSSHRNGASDLSESIHEAIWSNLLAEELPYGAFRVVAIIATGSHVHSGGMDGRPRVLIVREDPLRPGHFVINPSAEKLNDPRDRARIDAAMKNIVKALPQPAGANFVDEGTKFRSGIFEFIDRQAIQHSYAWAHSLFHGGTSATNTGMDGRMLDFGTFSAFDGYPKARVIDEDGFMGETVTFKIDLLKDIRDSWVKSLSPALLAALPSEQEWFDRFESTYQSNRQAEMLRLAGVFTEFKAELLKTSEGQRLAKLLIYLAEAGNDQKIEIWKGENPFEHGVYNVGAILSTAAHSQDLQKLIPNDLIRKQFTTSYKNLFIQQQRMAANHGINAKAETEYRKIATEIRNKKNGVRLSPSFQRKKYLEDFRRLSNNARGSTHSAIYR
jgi:uncharacterized protein YdiU (UPF0061 family)